MRDFTRKLSVIEGSATSTMQGFGERYIVPFALRLGASNSEVAILSAVPAFISSLAQLWSAKLAEQPISRRVMLLRFTFLQALLFLPLFLLPVITQNVWVLILCFTLYLACSNFMIPLWSSWIGDVVPLGIRARYFSVRSKFSQIFLFMSVLSGGVILQVYDEHIWTGFAILFGAAFIARLVSFVLFVFHKEPTYKPEVYNTYTFWSFLEEISTHRFGRFVVFRSLLAFALMITSPFFAVLMLTEFGFSYIQFSIVILVPLLVKAISNQYWAGLQQTIGHKNVLKIASYLVALLPLLWFIVSVATSGYLRYVIIIAIQLFGGFAWAGLELVSFNYMLDASNARNRVRLFAYFNVVFNVCVLAGGVLGALAVYVLHAFVTPFQAILILLIVSGLLRGLVTLIFLPRIRRIGGKRTMHTRKLLYDVVLQKPIGFASSSALASMTLVSATMDKSLQSLQQFTKRR